MGDHRPGGYVAFCVLADVRDLPALFAAVNATVDTVTTVQPAARVFARVDAWDPGVLEFEFARWWVWSAVQVFREEFRPELSMWDHPPFGIGVRDLAAMEAHRLRVLDAYQEAGVSLHADCWVLRRWMARHPGAVPPNAIAMFDPEAARRTTAAVMDPEVTMIEQTYEEWAAEATRRFGDARNWRFVCPRCGHVASVGDFGSLGADGSRAAVECIGRVFAEIERDATRKRDSQVLLEGSVDPNQPCDWAAFGLLGTLGKGRIVRRGELVQEAFDFADADA